MTKSQFEEFFSTDSISRKQELREVLHNAIDAFFRDDFDAPIEFTWYFPDAEENEIGTFEKYYDFETGEVCIECHYFANSRSKQKCFNIADILEQPV